jgi:hypothetical protein
MKTRGDTDDTCTPASTLTVFSSSTILYDSLEREILIRHKAGFGATVKKPMPKTMSNPYSKPTKKGDKKGCK